MGVLGAATLGFPTIALAAEKKRKLLVGAHVWIYASTQSGYDVSSILPQIFSDMKYAGIDGVETMEHPLRKDVTTKIIGELIEEYQLPLLGSSYGAEMWDKTKQSRLIESLLIRIPLPAFYFDGTNDDEWLVVDGLQRISTFRNFIVKDVSEVTDEEGKVLQPRPPLPVRLSPGPASGPQ